MPIEFRCPGCSRLLRTPEESAGKKAKCPQCGTIADVPATTAAETTPLPSVTPLDRGPAWSPPAPGAQPLHGPSRRTSREAVEPINPYASPAATPFSSQAAELSLNLQHQRVSLDEILNRSWLIFKEQWGSALFGLVFIAISMGVGMATGIFRVAAQASGDVTIMVLGIVAQQLISFLVNTFFQLGMILFAVRFAHSGEARLNDLFAAGPFYLGGLLVTFLLQLMIGGTLLVCMAPGLLAIMSEEPGLYVPLLVVGGLVAMAAIIYLTMRFYLASVFVVDRNLGALDAFAASSSFMVGNKLTAFIGGLVVAIVGGLFALVTCCIGSVFLVPYTGLFLATLYLLVTGQSLHKPAVLQAPTAGRRTSEFSVVLPWVCHRCRQAAQSRSEHPRIASMTAPAFGQPCS